ncbi:hypothetical protein [Frankia sp. AgB32]|uniref:hypothetical protein n=1 Tax=Frankia sp. AgB32 TaxID=631119 RepID=UPI00200E87FE|nr:hypothetical protein [Frankia sp. AgB32]MCK9895019.1 hypothetical protein [Frankia sp. AgB32]
MAVRRWQADWDSWSVGAEATRGLRRWAGEPALAGCCGSVTDLLAACGRDRAVPVPVADGRLAALIAFARAGDRAAARVVLERVMPALTVQAAKRARRGGGAGVSGVTGAGFSEVLAELVGAAWLVICTFPLDRRPRKIAVNVVLDTVYRVFGYRPRMDRATVYLELIPDAPAGLDGRPVAGWDRGGSSAELLDVLAESVAGGVELRHLQLLAKLAVAGRSQKQVAASAGITDRGVRLRRDAAVRAVRAVILPAADGDHAERAPVAAGRIAGGAA